MLAREGVSLLIGVRDGMLAADEGLSIEELQATAKWKAIVEAARTTSRVLELPASR